MNSKEIFLRDLVKFLSAVLLPFTAAPFVAWLSCLVFPTDWPAAWSALGKLQGLCILGPIFTGACVWLLVTSEDKVSFTSFAIATVLLLVIGLFLGTFGAELVFNVSGPTRVVYAGMMFAATMGFLLLIRTFVVRIPVLTRG